MLAGSDIPLPRGFVWVIAGPVVICVRMALAIPWVWDGRRRHGLRAVLVRTGNIGLVVRLLLAAAFALFSSGEPSAPPRNAAAYLIWFSVVTKVGAVNGIVVGLVTSCFCVPLAEWRAVVESHGCAPGGAPDSRNSVGVVFCDQVAHDAQGH